MSRKQKRKSLEKSQARIRNCKVQTKPCSVVVTQLSQEDVEKWTIKNSPANQKNTDDSYFLDELYMDFVKKEEPADYQVPDYEESIENLDYVNNDATVEVDESVDNADEEFILGGLPDDDVDIREEFILGKLNSSEDEACSDDGQDKTRKLTMKGCPSDEVSEAIRELLNEPVDQALFTCSLCPMTKTKKFLLLSHIQIKHVKTKVSKGRIHCALCDQFYSSLHSFHRHCRKHTLEKIVVSCPFLECDFVTSSFRKYKEEMDMHLDTKHKGKPVPITNKMKVDVLESAESVNPKLITELKNLIAMESDDYKCPLPLCSVMTKEKYKIISHVQLLHLHSSTESSSSSVMCYFCGNLITRQNFNRHCRLHANEQRKRCPKRNCTFVYYFGSEDKLDLHLKTEHSGEQNLHECRLRKACTFRCNSEDELAKHMKMCRKTLFQCELCNYKARRKDSVINHMRSHKKVKCNYPNCAFIGISFSDLQIHTRTHGNMNFQCRKCEFTARDKHHMKRHEKRMHKLTDGKCLRINKEIKCGHPTCAFIALTPHELQVHRRTHRTMRFQCRKCEYTAADSHGMKLHEMRLHKLTDGNCLRIKK